MVAIQVTSAIYAKFLLSSIGAFHEKYFPDPKTLPVELRARAKITSPVWVLRHLSGKAQGLHIFPRRERTSNAARRDWIDAQTGEVIFREP